MGNVLDVLKERGFVQQVTDEAAVREALDRDSVTCYIGFDPTAESLHVGSLLPIMALAHMLRHGHNPIAILGGGTALVGDPSGKTEMRQMLSHEQIEENGKGLQAQLQHYLTWNGRSASVIDNFQWLGKLRYIDFLRDIGRHFSVNRMLAMEAYKIRLEAGLSFIEFNYQLLQAYDYLVLFCDHGCTLQMGGDDQWGNILAGVDLVRRVKGATVQGLTFPLITTASGEKMGKTASGAIWLDKEKTSPYDFFQYWVNTDDKDVLRFLAYFTFLPMSEVRRVGDLRDAELNAAKTMLAYEVTKERHGEEEARRALSAAQQVFGSRDLPEHILPSSTIPRRTDAKESADVPTSTIDQARMDAGILAVDLFCEVGLSPSKGQARRLIQQGGLYVNDKRIEDIGHTVSSSDLVDGVLMLRSGKKRYHRVVVA